MNAPVDIIISIIDRMKSEYESDLKEHDLKEHKGYNPTCALFIEGKIEAMEELKNQLEGFKKLFN